MRSSTPESTRVKQVAAAKKRWSRASYRKKQARGVSRNWKKTHEQRCQSISKAVKKSMTPERRAAISLQRKGKTMVQIHGVEAARRIYKKRYGYYPEDRDPGAQLDRESFQGKLWALAVKERDGYKCQKCPAKGGHLHAHHIKPWVEYPELRFDISNGITLCQKCHKKEHRVRKILGHT